MNPLKFLVLVALTFGATTNSYAAFPDDLDDVVFIEEGIQPGVGSFVRSMAVTANLIAEVSGNHPFGGQNVILNSDKTNVWRVGGGNLSCCNSNAWGFIKVGDIWYGGTWEFMRRGQTVKSSRALVGPNHFRFAPLARYQPSNGDVVGFMVAGITRPGLARNNVRERSNVSFYRIGDGPVSADEIRGTTAGAPPLTPVLDLLMDDSAE